MIDANDKTDAINLFSQDKNAIIVCPGCDMVHEKMEVCEGQAGVCHRCDLEFVFPPVKRIDHTIALAITSLILMVGAASFPLLSMSRAGLHSQATLLQIASYFTEGWYILVGLFFLFFVIIFPTFRSFALIYTLLPLWRERAPYPYAKEVYGLSEKLSPWSMSEIFIIGTGVALIKVGKLAKVEFGFSFWIFVLLVISLGFMNFTMHRKSIWDQLKQGKL